MLWFIPLGKTKWATGRTATRTGSSEVPLWSWRAWPLATQYPCNAGHCSGYCWGTYGYGSSAGGLSGKIISPVVLR